MSPLIPNSSSGSGKSKESTRGTALVEFALILPVLLMLTLTVVELIRAYNITKVAAQLSREAANLSFRHCTGLGSTDLTTCLNGELKAVETFAQQNGITGTQIILSVYQTDNSTPPILTLKGQSNGDPGDQPSLFSVADGFTPELKALPNQTNYVAEVYIPYSSIVKAFKGVFAYEIPFIYDSTVA